jgi:hypothetical protein
LEEEDIEFNDVYKILLQEREERRLEFAAADLALKQFEIASSRNSSNLIRGTYDYGFTSQSNGNVVNTKNADGDAVPASAIKLAFANFAREFKNLIKSFQASDYEVTDEALKNLKQLKLSNEAIWERERSREVCYHHNYYENSDEFVGWK